MADIEEGASKKQSPWKSTYDLVAKIGSFIFGPIGAVVSIYDFFKLFQGDQELATWGFAITGSVMLLIASVHIGWFYRPIVKPGDKISLSGLSVTARAIAIVVILASLITGLWIYQRNVERNQRFVVLVLDFVGTDPENYQVREEVVHQINDAMQPYALDSEVIGANIQVGEDDGSERAIELGERYRADLVLWGRYQIQDNYVRLTIHIENLAELSRITIPSDDYTEESIAEALEFEDVLTSQTKAIALFVSGMTRYEIEDYSGAEQRISEAIEEGDWPEQFITPAILYFYRGYARLRLDDCLGSISDYNFAIPILQAADSSEPNYAIRLAKSYNNRGQAFRCTGDVEAALDDYQRAIETDREYLSPILNTGIVHGEQDEYDLAMEWFRKVLEIDPESPAAFNNIGIIYYRQAQYQQAIAQFELALESDPNYPPAFNNRGLTYERLENFDLAFQDYTQAIALNPEYAIAYNNRGDLYLQQDFLDLALADLNQAIALDPGYALAYYNRGTAYIERDELELALADFNQAIALDPDYAPAYNNRGYVYVQRDSYGLALADFNQTIALDPEYASAYNNRGSLYHKQESYDLALADLNQAILLRPDYAMAYLNRGRTYGELTQYDRAISDFTMAINFDPRLVKAYYYRGITYQYLGNYESAISDFRMVMELSQDEDLLQDVFERLGAIGAQP